MHMACAVSSRWRPHSQMCLTPSPWTFHYPIPPFAALSPWTSPSPIPSLPPSPLGPLPLPQLFDVLMQHNACDAALYEKTKQLLDRQMQVVSSRWGKSPLLPPVLPPLLPVYFPFTSPITPPLLPPVLPLYSPFAPPLFPLYSPFAPPLFPFLFPLDLHP